MQFPACPGFHTSPAPLLKLHSISRSPSHPAWTLLITQATVVILVSCSIKRSLELESDQALYV